MVAPCVYSYCSIVDEERGFAPYNEDEEWKLESLDISFSTRGIFGLGTDPLSGPFLIRGDLCKDTMTAQFVKQFVTGNNHQVTYNGRINISGTDIICKGVWEDVKLQLNGMFKIQGKFGDHKHSSVDNPEPFIEYQELDERGPESPHIGLKAVEEKPNDSILLFILMYL